MIYIYVIVSILCGLIVFRPSRVFDFVSLGFLSQQLYFSPLLFQSAGYCGAFGCYDYRVATVGVLLASSIMGFSLIKTHRGAGGERLNRSVATREGVNRLSMLSLMMLGFGVLAIVGFSWLVYASSGKIFSLEKSEMLSYVSYNYIVWVTATTLGFLVALYKGSKPWVVFFLSLFAINVYIGFRSPAAIAMFSAFILVSSRYSVSISRLKLRWIVCIIVMGLAFFTYKGFYAAIKLGDYDLLFSRVQDLDYYFFIFQNAEPVLTLSILSNVLSHGLYIGPGDLVRVLPVFFLFMDGLFSDMGGFNSVIQPLYYANISGGVGSNVWAHMFAMLGWLGLVIFILLYASSLYLLSRWFVRSGVYTKILLAYAGSCWAFYIHRNDFVYQLNLEKRIILMFLVVYIVAYFVNKAMVRAKHL